jgi:hypothetical protein
MIFAEMKATAIGSVLRHNQMKGRVKSIQSTINLHSCQTHLTSINSCQTQFKSLHSCQTHFMSLHSCQIHFMSHIQKICLNSKNGCKNDQIQGIMGTTIRTRIRIINGTVSSNNLMGVVNKTFIRTPHSRIKTVDLSSINRDLLTLPQLSLNSYKGKRRFIRSFWSRCRLLAQSLQGSM